MFTILSGPEGKAMMIQQGYVPATCTLADTWGPAIIYIEVSKGNDPCAGCNEDRARCHGRPKGPRNW